MLFQLRLLGWFFRRYLSSLPPNREILKQYLYHDHTLRQNVIAQYTMPLFNGLHPKNVFHFRGEFLLKYARPHDIVIDVGCGTGRILYALSASIEKGYGLDYRAENLNICRTRHARPNLEFLAADLHTFDWAQFKQTNPYNTALLSHILEHLPDPVAFLKTLDAEKLLICVPSEENWLTQLRKYLKLPYRTDAGHYKEYSRRQLAAELTAAGYAIQALGYNAEGEIECCATRPTVSVEAQPRICYAGMAPDSFEIAAGGRVKLLYLQQAFPEYFADFDILYLVSSALPPNLTEWLALCKAQRKKIVLNQNGVGYPGWAGDRFELVNQPLRQALQAADYVLYQSEFTKIGADLFLGRTDKPSAILYNPVDTGIFSPAETPPNLREPILLLAGNQYHAYRIGTAFQTIAILKEHLPGIKLFVTGTLRWSKEQKETDTIVAQLLDELHIRNQIVFIGSYTRAEAVDIYRQAHILLHPQYNDVCPTVVLEAMACGLPVVYSNSGGTPELVGAESGIGIPTELSWDRNLPPAPADLADAVGRVLSRYHDYSTAARRRAVECFDLPIWLDRQRAIFESLLPCTCKQPCWHDAMSHVHWGVCEHGCSHVRLFKG